MAVLDIGGQRVEVDDKFLKMSHEEQTKTVNEISSHLTASNIAQDMSKASIGDVAKSAITNIPQSAVEFAKNTVQPIVHPLDTARAIGNLDIGLAQKADKAGLSALVPFVGPVVSLAKKLGYDFGDKEQYADALGQFLKDRYGSVGALKKTIATDPVGVLADASLVLTGGGSAVARGPGIVGEVGRVVSRVGQAIDPLSIATKVGGNVGTKILGVTTGVGDEAIKTAFRAGQQGGDAATAFRENLTGQADIRQVVDDAKAAVGQLRQERGEAYRSAMKDIGADNTVLSFDQIDKAITEVQGVQKYKGQDLSPTTAKVREQISDAVDEWRGLPAGDFHTAEGLDALKKKIGDIRDGTQYGTPERVVADNIYRAIRKTIVDQAPEYGKAMKAYEEASDIIGEIEKTLSLKPNANVDTSLRKLQSVLRDNVNTNYGRRRDLLDFLMRSGAPHLLEKLAGQALSSGVPRGLSRVTAGTEGGAAVAAALAGQPHVALGLGGLLAASSPKLVGGASYGAGVASRFPLRALGRSAFQIGRLQDQQ